MRSERPLSSERPSKIQLMLQAPGGACWSLTFSAGMERFIGPYSRVPGLASASPLLEYQEVGCARSG